VLVLPGTGVPFAAMYLKADPPYHIIKHLFEALPILTHILKSIFGILSGLVVPLGIILFRYFVMLPALYEGFRSLALILIIIVLSAAQFKDAFDYQSEFLQTLKHNGSQCSLQHVLRYREILIIRNTLGDAMNFGLLGAIVGIVLTVIWVNFYIIKMYHLLPPAISFMLVCYVTVGMSGLMIGMEEGAAINEASIQLVKRFRRGTILVQSGQRRYLLKVFRSLQVFSFTAGVPGFDFFSISTSAKNCIVQFIMDNTINALLTF
jgi:hypothetical protein